MTLTGNVSVNPNSVLVIGNSFALGNATRPDLGGNGGTRSQSTTA